MGKTLNTKALGADSVTEADIADGAVTNTKILTVSASKLTGALPAISGANLTGIDAGAEITSSTFSGSGSGGANATSLTTTYFTMTTITIDANKAGTLVFDATHTGSTSSGGGSSVSYGGTRMQLAGASTGTVREQTIITPSGNGTKIGASYGRLAFTSNASSRSLTIQTGSSHLHSSPGTVALTGIWTLTYTS